MNNHKSILAVGSIALDNIQTIHDTKKNLLGGSATYFSIAASLFTKTNVVGVVGTDFPQEHWDLLKSKRINTENIKVLNGETFSWGGKYDYNFKTRETIFTNLGVFEHFNPQISYEAKNSPLVFLGNIHPELQLTVAQSINKPEYIITDTMNLWIDTAPELLNKVINLTDIMLLNDEESLQLTSARNITDAANILLKMGPKSVIIKLGSKGALIAHNQSHSYIPVYPIERVIDPTGAGDSFAGGFMGYLSQNNNTSLLEAVKIGSAVASFCVEDFGVNGLLKMDNTKLKNRVKIISELYNK